jgi:hypothetical protein
MTIEKQKLINLIRQSQPADMTCQQISSINSKSEAEAIAAIKAEHRKAQSLLIIIIRM